MSAIEWTDETWNPVTGCSKVSEGCDNCYAETLALGRLKGKPGYPGLPWTSENAAENVVLRPERLRAPYGWRRPRMVFVNSMSDLFHPRVPSQFINDVWMAMFNNPRHTYQILTKRPKRLRDWTLMAAKAKGWPADEIWPDWIWVGTSIESRDHVDRACLLGETPASVRFVSAEPLLGPLLADRHEFSLDPATDRVEESWTWPDDYTGPMLSFYNEAGEPAFHWLIAGGESGLGHRPVGPEWVRALRDVCVHEGVAFFFKQWGGRTPKAGGRILDGRTWDEFPQRSAVAS